MSDANAERGEITVALEGEDYVLTPSFEAQVAIERLTGRTVEQLAQAAGSGAMSLEDAAVVVTECIRAHGKAHANATEQAFNAARVGECIVDAGKLQVVKRLELLLYLAATGGYTAQGNPKPLATTASPSEAPVTGA